ncbi:acetyl-CoA synthetase-like protein [Xylona heveae TC161]|uniref:Acetyl-CoA synthetase-like protein n=1 Tax=Xylona heveae (strain CBS 132557 / TC161) TaxID=1328760 RepID=A0A165I1L3_XYLHT|nr:acetyl-CoA synthetase-like protein [Xylona heveae TC161]KZF24229.1 acetyl-CoA synthetase-like protein [Xylona heveae TC161]
MASTLPRLPILEAIANHDPKSTAVIHSLSGRTFTYGSLLNDIAEAKDRLLQASNRNSIEGERVAFLVENGYDYIVTLLSIMASRSIAVPMSAGFPASELQYIIDNSDAMMLLSSGKFQGKAEEVMKGEMNREPIFHLVEKKLGASVEDKNLKFESADAEAGTGGMMLYTSGTTNRPKGVLLTQSTLSAQTSSLLEAWRYSPNDHLLHVLPLHHIHGTVNAILTPLLAGSTIEFMFPFNARAVWERLAAPFLPLEQRTTRSSEKITFLTAVPTIYNRLLSSHKDLPPEIEKAGREAVSPQNMRLNISGSAALPTPTKAAWSDLSGGNVLLERYGMTEVGMALSCGLDFGDRVDGSVGWPLPQVQVKLVDTETKEVIKESEEIDESGKEREGEIQLRGPTIFTEYWNNPKATSEEFVEGDDGKGKWFKTGDVAIRRIVNGAGKSDQPWAKGPMYFIQGRKSVDIIKTGGEKVSALEVERELLSLPQIAEAAVVGLPSDVWGQKVAAVVVLNPEAADSGRGGKKWGPMDMRRALKDKLANYKIPQELKVIEGGLPRNAMGKINKKGLIKEIFPEQIPN